MTKIFTNLRIGTKLAITSVLSILLIAMMIFGQMSGNAAVRKMNESAVAQQTVGHDAMEVRASVRGMQIGVRDVRLAPVLPRPLKLTLMEWRERYCFKEEPSLCSSQAEISPKPVSALE